jgi:hypothetical protein
MKKEKKYKCLILDDMKSLETILSIISIKGVIYFLGIGEVEIEEIAFVLTRTPEEYFFHIYSIGMPDLLILDNDLGPDKKEGNIILKDTINSFDCKNLKGFTSCSLNFPARENMISFFSCWLKFYEKEK